MKFRVRIFLVAQVLMLLSGIGVIAYALSIPKYSLANPMILIAGPLAGIPAVMSVFRFLHIRSHPSQ